MSRTKIAYYAYDPDYTVCPGKTVADAIRILNVTQKQFAKRIGYSEKHLIAILSGKAPLNHEIAIRLERVTGTPARIWNRLEAEYRERLVRLEEKKKLEEHTDFLNASAIKELLNRKVIPKSENRAEQIDAVLRFFGVGSIQALFEALRVPQNIALRHSTAFEINPLALATWLRLGELQAEKIECKLYEKKLFLTF